MEIKDINPYIRFADVMYSFENREFVRAYDERFLYILEGEGSLILENEKLDFCKDSVCYYPQGLHYKLEAKDEIKFVSVNFDFFQNLSEVMTVMPPNPDKNYDPKKAIKSDELLSCKLFNSPFVMGNIQKLKECFLDIAEHCTCGELYGKETGSSILKYAVCVMLKSSSGEKVNATFENTAAYINENYMNMIDNKSVAKALSYHPNYLNSVIKQKTGMSLHRYITEVRLKNACRLLGRGMSVGETAINTGFCNADHFSVCFKKYMGVNPSEYAKYAV
ncbi:MAG: helix-turn-helix domain-containing protein [Bacillota bacterium]|nr:helix-turn-helix domain-containing protein [Bacillota bacterium]